MNQNRKKIFESKKKKEWKGKESYIRCLPNQQLKAKRYCMWLCTCMYGMMSLCKFNWIQLFFVAFVVHAILFFFPTSKSGTLRLCFFFEYWQFCIHLLLSSVTNLNEKYIPEWQKVIWRKIWSKTYDKRTLQNEM